MAGLTIFGLTLSSTLLPPFKILIVLLAVVALLTWLLWRSSIRIYSKAQIALQETLSQPPPAHGEKAAAIPALLREADLQALTIGEHSMAARKLIRELALRTKTGASVVGIERAGKAIINPGPDEELLPGDQILIIGSAEQLVSARALMA